MGKILFAKQDGVHALKFIGDVRLTLGPTIAAFLEKLKSSSDFRSMVIDLSETSTIDSTALGLIAKIAVCTREHFGHATSIISPNEDITRVLVSMAMEEVCVIADEPLPREKEMLELPHEAANEDTLRNQVIDAHRTLMGLNGENSGKFRELVEALEYENTHLVRRVAGS